MSLDDWFKGWYTCHPDARERRLDTCRGCEQFAQMTQQCKRCGCLMPFKVRFGKMKCPDGKWGEEPPGETSVNEMEKQQFLNDGHL